MKTYRNIFVMLVILLTTLTSCEKDSNEKEPDISSTTSWIWSVTNVTAEVELEGQTENDKELIEQIENEIKVKMTLLGDYFTFTTNHENPNSGQLIRTFRESQKKIISEYLYEMNGNAHYLKIIEHGAVTYTFQLSTENVSYFVMDFTKDYNQSNNRIVSALGVARYTITR